MRSDVAKKNPATTAQDRLRVYQARQAVHQVQVARRRRDQVVGVSAAVVAVLVASFAYWGWSVGPGAPESEDLTEAIEEAVAAVPEETESTGVPDIALSEYRKWDAEMVIDDVSLSLELNGLAAPQAVASFVTLAQDGFFDQTSCHRLVTEGIFVLQCGDPTGSGTGGPDYRFGPIENAPADDLYPAGTLAMARVGGDGASMGSQFFIVYSDSVIPSDAAGGYTVLGQVTSGLDELIAEVTDLGGQGGQTDGAPVAPAEISVITIR
jgi:peptidyl-prolyl cis-trans isomerase B (cyclophilin B)